MYMFDVAPYWTQLAERLFYMRETAIESYADLSSGQSPHNSKFSTIS